MSYESTLELLDEFNQWVVAKKAGGLDVSPSAFLVDRAKDEALTRINDALDKLDYLYEEYNGDDPTGDMYDGGVIFAVGELRQILEDKE